MALLTVHHPGRRPGQIHQWHVHGWTHKTIELLGKDDSTPPEDPPVEAVK